MKRKLAMILFWLSSILKFAGKLVASDKTIIVNCLTLPGWFIMDECLIHQTPCSEKIIGFEWQYWPMPDEYCNEMQKLKGKVKKGV